MMHFISVWNPKGGQGKSTIALNLCAAATVEFGLKCLLIDDDPQGTSMAFYQNGRLPFAVIPDVPNERPDADLVMIDHRAGDWDIPQPQVILMPTRAGREQFRTYSTAAKRAEDAGKTVLTVLTEWNSQRKQERELAEYLEGQGAFSIPATGVFTKASENYRTIFDEEMGTAYKIKARRDEFKRILGRLMMQDQTEIAQEVANG
jgi:chromosome partitioning protein